MLLSLRTILIISQKTPFLVFLLLFLVVFQVEVVLIGWIPPRAMALPRALLPERLEFEAWEPRDLKQIPRSAVVVGTLPWELFGVICSFPGTVPIIYPGLKNIPGLGVLKSPKPKYSPFYLVFFVCFFSFTIK